MIMRVDVKPELLRWARERAGIEADTLVGRFPHYVAWESGDARPTLKQLERFANTVHASLGYFFLPEPPDEPFPIPDFRTVGGAPIERPSPDLLDTVYLCQQRQDWYLDFARMEGQKSLPFVGSVNPKSDVEASAAEMRAALRFDLEERRVLAIWTEAFRRFIEQADALGVLVMVSGIVGNNTHRKLDPEEFRGFALADAVAPLVFVNGADTKAAQMFTLAHELAHVWLGESGVSNAGVRTVPDETVERWCNRVAAELLVPSDVMRDEYDRSAELGDEAPRLARRFKVSTLVVLRRIYDVGGLDRSTFRSAYRAELERLRTLPKSSGGSFYPTLRTRVGRRFGQAVVTSTLEGRTSFSESFRLLGIRKMSTFHDIAHRLGVGM